MLTSVVQRSLQKDPALAALINVTIASMSNGSSVANTRRILTTQGNKVAVTYAIYFSAEQQQFSSAADSVSQLVAQFTAMIQSGNFTRFLQASSAHFAGVIGASTVSASSFSSHVVTAFSPSAAPSFIPGKCTRLAFCLESCCSDHVCISLICFVSGTISASPRYAPA